MNFAFYGRVSTEDQQDPEASRAWQLVRARALIEPRGGQIVAEYFDVGQSRALPWQRRPQAAALLVDVREPSRGFDAVVIGEPHRAFYGNQFGLTLPVLTHFGVELWVPEVGGPIDPNNEAHELVMSVFGGMSKGERNRIKVRVRSAMESQTELEGRYLGGRPPYGYTVVEGGPHPNPAKAAEGRRLRVLAIDEVTAPVVRRIFTEFLAGVGIFAIAEGLTADGIPCPSAYDRRRNSHRSGVAWSKGAVRTILTNPRYTGFQVWNKQRTDEVLLDVDDVALGYTAKMRWNPRERWVQSRKRAHPAIVDADTFARVQDLFAAGTRASGPRTRNTYVLRGSLYCGVCDRRMQGQHSHGTTYYRCRFPQEYALANRVTHPGNVYLREDAVMEPLDDWLLQALAPHQVEDAVEAMEASQHDEVAAARVAAARATVRECEAKLARYRAALDSGADPAVISGWITQTQAERTLAESDLRQATGRSRMSRDEIRNLVAALGDLRTVIRDAEPADKAEVYRQLGLKLTYHPETQTVRAEANLEPHRGVDRVRGAIDTVTPRKPDDEPEIMII